MSGRRSPGPRIVSPVSPSRGTPQAVPWSVDETCSMRSATGVVRRPSACGGPSPVGAPRGRPRRRATRGAPRPVRRRGPRRRRSPARRARPGRRGRRSRSSSKVCQWTRGACPAPIAAAGAAGRRGACRRRRGTPRRCRCVRAAGRRPARRGRPSPGPRPGCAAAPPRGAGRSASPRRPAQQQPAGEREEEAGEDQERADHVPGSIGQRAVGCGPWPLRAPSRAGNDPKEPSTRRGP